MGPISVWQALIVLAIALLIVWTRYKRWPLVTAKDGRNSETNGTRSEKRLLRWVIPAALGMFVVLATASWLSI